MKTYLKRALVALMVCSLAAVTALGAKVKKAHVKLDSDVMVNGTLLKAGEYDFRFNEENGELTILKNGEVKAKTTVRAQARNGKARNTTVRTRLVGNVTEFVGLTFGGSSEDVIVSANGAPVTGN